MLIKGAGDGWVFYCPACEEKHVVPNASWGFNGNLDKPSFAHSVSIRGWFTREHKTRLRNPGEGDDVCHVTISEGSLVYAADCTHDFAGKTIPMVDLASYEKEV